MTLKKEIEDILHPPKAPIPIIGEKSVGHGGSSPRQSGKVLANTPIDSKPVIDEDLNLDEMFEWCAQNSSFRRWLIEFVKKVMPGFEGKYHRFSKEEMNKVFMQKRKEAAHKIKSFDQNARNYKNVMAEYLEKLEKLK